MKPVVPVPTIQNRYGAPSPTPATNAAHVPSPSGNIASLADGMNPDCCALASEAPVRTNTCCAAGAHKRKVTPPATASAPTGVPRSTPALVVAMTPSGSVVPAQHEQEEVLVRRVDEAVQVPPLEQREVPRLKRAHLEAALAVRHLRPVADHHDPRTIADHHERLLVIAVAVQTDRGVGAEDMEVHVVNRHKLLAPSARRVLVPEGVKAPGRNLTAELPPGGLIIREEVAVFEEGDAAVRIGTRADVEEVVPAAQDHAELKLVVRAAKRIPHRPVGGGPRYFEVQRPRGVERVVRRHLMGGAIGERLVKRFAREVLGPARQESTVGDERAAVERGLAARVERRAKVGRRTRPSPNLDRIACRLRVIGNRQRSGHRILPHSNPQPDGGAQPAAALAGKHGVGAGAIAEPQEWSRPGARGRQTAHHLGVRRRERFHVLLLEVALVVLLLWVVWVEDIAVRKLRPVEHEFPDREEILQLAARILLAAGRKLDVLDERHELNDRIVVVVVLVDARFNRKDLPVKDLHDAPPWIRRSGRGRRRI